MLVLDEEVSNPEHGHTPASRPVQSMLEYGLVPLDKPRGPTSHEVVAWTRKLLGMEKAGHSGTLDPPVSGLLPIGLGQSTRALSLLLLYPKEYRGVMRIHSSVPKKEIGRVKAEFTGEIFQRPPQRSSVSRQTRTRTIYEFEIEESVGNLHLFRVLCQSGTYIRKLIYDIGEVLGVGATMVELRRTKVGPLTEEKGFVTLHQLNDAMYRLKAGDEGPIRKLVLPVEESLGPIGRIVVRDSAVDAICHGARLGIPGVLSLSSEIKKDDPVAVMSAKGEMVAIGKALLSAEEVRKLKRGLAASTDRVVMKAGTYPRMWKSHGGKAEPKAASPS
ncbi:MAG: RNA-guided pseudouridylation complex pseudouridine synthase subunit Cbf5 [Nitrososphaerota archaeon]|jgi:H/ACA ribonucleoprotein complex subunit 4|nr:RNA-guided pseudouridylation complex pseudouridine synthase subunit Cbf5 [Nitrososphaerota archaeon]MDG6952666.1 RNA-guided pseudouridylation complex pseudouridine synthase subunit Cbf5 [Nitrososphaerota archaeon]MDG6955962.1 RNA-guided pseudouridylation complex pseudouridine synthase subunit Cbf5 [Nitrososphaerota archaeon]MDG6957182.1 RNA-guided pseudouridylation complex pseudouridine synthase subunit Cbf5 [Nitrososphaerota archaeon]MDG6959099.1 RNA-guided pseudouridylation complex pseudou